MAVSVTYSAAAGLTQSYVADSSDAVFSIEDVALTGEVQAVAAVLAASEGTDFNAFGTTVLTCGAGGATKAVDMADGSAAGQIKTIIIAAHDGNNQVVNINSGGSATFSTTGVVQLIWTGSAWAELLDTNNACVIA